MSSKEIVTDPTIGPPPSYQAPAPPSGNNGNNKKRTLESSQSVPNMNYGTNDNNDNNNKINNNNNNNNNDKDMGNRFGNLKKKPKKLGGRLLQVKNYNRVKSNSTSTLYIDSTVSSPDVDKLLHCTAISIFNHISKCQNLPEEEKVYFDIFDERTFPLSTDDFDTTTPPTVMEIYKFIEVIFTTERLSHECAIMMLAYIERTSTLTNLTVDSTNWRRVVLSTLILASKVWEDQAVWNVDFLSVFPTVTVKDLGQLEKILLRLLQYNVSLKSSLYTKYYFELRSLNEESFPLEPLNKEGAKRLEANSQSEEERYKEEMNAQSQRLVRSKSLNELDIDKKNTPLVVIN